MLKPVHGPIATLVAAIFLAVLAPGAAISQNVFEACSGELNNLCSEVTPGDGRTLACLYANEDKLSEACDAATAETLDLLDGFFELVRYTKQECRADIAKLCSAVEIGEGRIYACLQSNATQLSDQCGAVIDNISLPVN
jgi:Cysteine rich repeat